MTVGILAEKESAAENMAAALGGMRGQYKGESYVITHAVGHCLEYVDPAEMVPADRAETIKKWSLDQLPWNKDEFSFSRHVMSGKSSVISDIRKTLGSVDEIVIATDNDPSGEGDLLAWEIIDHLGLHSKKITRMEFVDEAAPSIQKAFSSRRDTAPMNEEAPFRKAEYRSRFDLLSMQWTRVATLTAAVRDARQRRIVLRNGRLKSAMAVLVGNQIAAYEQYQRVPKYVRRFKDDRGVEYKAKDETKYDREDQVPDDVSASTVVHDGVERKSTPPPRLMDLSALSSLLASEGFKATKVVDTYQTMYEHQVVSYPRTEDKVVSHEQFNEFLGLVDRIARVVGVDPAVLTHREPRPRHVKDGGAHGANRPGPAVPASLDDLEATYGRLGRRIYEVLALNTLRMVAEDYEYDHHTGHVSAYPAFVGSINVPAVPGWKALNVGDESDDDDDDDDEESSQATTLGDTAEPIVAEVVAKRPPMPTMKWLMEQLEKKNIGTGATRTSTYGEVTSGPSAMLKDSKGKITLSNVGTVIVRILPGTHIGDLELTRDVYERMDRVASGSLTIDEALEPIADQVKDDIETIRKNVSTLSDDVKASLGVGASADKRITVQCDGREAKIKPKFGTYTLTDDDVKALSEGKTIRVTTKTKSGRDAQVDLRLGDYTFKGKTWFGLVSEFVKNSAAQSSADRFTGTFEGKKVSVKRTWGGHTFSDDEVARLLEGKEISFSAVSKAKKKYTARGKLTWSGKWANFTPEWNY